ncbi:MAG: hypothetical protein Q9160_008031 [Pyrenula sp. 1 TL-2023]
MAPPSAETVVQEPTGNAERLKNGNSAKTLNNGNATKKLIRTPLLYSGALDKYEAFDVTSVIGREFPKAQLLEILTDDAKVRDLAITVSQRGVVFFRNQTIDIEQQKILGQKLGELTGKPESSKLHKHALLNGKRGITVDENGKLDNEISVISSEQESWLAKDGMPSIITFERVPSDYAVLKIVQDSEDAGGDTLWSSGYEAYDRLSPTWQKFADGLTATHYQPTFNQIAKDHGLELISEDRGAPKNNGVDFKASHPLVRTNPITGWKSLFGAAHQIHAGHIDNVTERESDILKAYFLQLIAENHDLQVRFRWNVNDVAIWDNRSTFHTATHDYEGKRQGNRVVSLGEVPYLDPGSVSRREALELAREVEAEAEAET